MGDVGHLILASEDEPNSGDFAEIPGWSHADVRTYEDYVLGKLYADFSELLDPLLRLLDELGRFLFRGLHAHV